jgi:psp operon transcriptional activator
VYKSSSNKIIEISFNPFNDPYDSTLENRQTKKNIENKNKGLEENTSTSAVHSETVLTKILKKPLKEAVKELEQYMLQAALKESRYNQKIAAEMLGLSYDQLRGIKRKYK